MLAVDLRGLGETRNVEKHGFAGYLGSEWREVFMAYLLGTSYLAMRAEDVAVCARFLARYRAGERPRPVHLVSIGRTGPPALHAAALENDLFASIQLTNCLTSWSDVVHTPLARNQMVNVVHGFAFTICPTCSARCRATACAWSSRSTHSSSRSRPARPRRSLFSQVTPHRRRRAFRPTGC